MGAVIALGGVSGGESAVSRGLSISPVFADVAIKASDTKVLHEVTLTNHSSVTQAFKLSVVDFGSLDEEGGVAFLGQSVNDLGRLYGLASWMKIDRTELSIPAGGSTGVKVTVENREDLEPGGHYGAVLATAVTDSQSGGSELRIGVKQVLSSLILVTKEGGSMRGLTLRSQEANASWWRMPHTLDQRFENQGNVHVVPRGVAQVVDPLGRTVRRAALNEGSGAILPGSFRHYRVTLDVLGSAWMPGRYKITTTYRPDGTDVTKTYITHFWYAGALILWLAGLAAMVAAGVLAWWLFWRLKRRSKTPKN